VNSLRAVFTYLDLEVVVKAEVASAHQQETMDDTIAPRFLRLIRDFKLPRAVALEHGFAYSKNERACVKHRVASITLDCELLPPHGDVPWKCPFMIRNSCDLGRSIAELIIRSCAPSLQNSTVQVCCATHDRCPPIRE
jgi:hypothetical protein